MSANEQLPAVEGEDQPNANRGSHLAEWLGQTGKVLTLIEPESGEHAFDLAVEELNRAQMHYAQAGFYMLFAKQELAHGTFVEYLQKHGIGVRAAQQSMQIALMLQRLPANTAAKIVALPKKKALALSRMDAEQIELLLTNHDPDEIAAMPRGDLEKHARGLATDLDATETELETARRQLANREALPRSTPWPDWVNHARTLSATLGDRALLAIDDFDQLAAELPDQLALTDTEDAHKRVAVTSAMANLQAIAARVSQTMARYGDEFGDYVAADDSQLPIADTDEAKRLLSNRALVVGEHQNARAEAELRAADRDAAAQPVKRGRGRPKGSKTRKART